MSRILVIEDDRFLAEIVREELTRAGYTPTLTHDGASGLAAFQKREPDLILLDLVLPDRTGFSILAEIRTQSAVPVIILTSKDGGEEKVTGLDLGADDYVTKPFRTDELLARVRARLRRPTSAREPYGTRNFGTVEVDLGARTVTVSGEEAGLTPTEFKLLEVLLRRHGKAVKREQLIAALNGGDQATEQALQTHISRLRRKLGGDGEKIRTVWGVGYRLDLEDAVGPA